MTQQTLVAICLVWVKIRKSYTYIYTNHRTSFVAKYREETSTNLTYLYFLYLFISIQVQRAIWFEKSRLLIWRDKWPSCVVGPPLTACHRSTLSCLVFSPVLALHQGYFLCLRSICWSPEDVKLLLLVLVLFAVICPQADGSTDVNAQSPVAPNWIRMADMWSTCTGQHWRGGNTQNIIHSHKMNCFYSQGKRVWYGRRCKKW